MSKNLLYRINHINHLSIRFINLTNSLNGRSFTKESGIRPGSSEHREPLKWANRLLELNKLQSTQINSPAMLNMVMLIRNKSIPYYCKALLQKYNLLTTVKFYTFVL